MGCFFLLDQRTELTRFVYRMAYLVCFERGPKYAARSYYEYDDTKILVFFFYRCKSARKVNQHVRDT